MLVSFTALILVALAGSLLALPGGGRGWLALCGRLGQGYFIGMLGVGVVALAFERAAWTGYAWPLAALVVVLALLGFRRVLAQLRPEPVGRDTVRVALALPVAVLLAAHLLIQVGEAAQQPIFPWDAWETWMYRARAMFLHPGAAFATPGVAVALANAPDIYPSNAAHYPLALTACIVWLARLHGEWRDPLLLVAWPVAWLALMLAFAALAQERGYSRTTVAVLVATLASTPLLTVHAALGGYMDLWMCAYLLIAASAAEAIAARHGDPADRTGQRVARWAWLLALLSAPALVKVEGLVWVLLLLLALAWGGSSRRTRSIALAAIALLVLAWLLPEHGMRLPGDRFVLARDFVRIPYLGESVLGFNPLLRPLWLAMFATATFGATWYLILAGLLLWPWARRQAGFASRPIEGLQLRFALLAAGFVLVLFGFTAAGVWAENHTAVSRILMQLTPVFLLAIAPVLERVFEPAAAQPAS